jgi:hypothetical protein
MRALFCSAILVAAFASSPALAKPAPIGATIAYEGEDDLPPGCFMIITGRVYCLPMPI